VRFRALNATFGRLERRSLSFAPGLNIIESPNESGKSTLAAFLRTMLYGLSTRERGTLADKNRYLPWSGLPLRGTLELETEAFGTVTLQRDTVRANSPMGRFSAVYAGTGNAVTELNASSCGETLLGVPREVYERSAFIRQSGLAVEPDAELERRIAALITTGEEGVSYSEAAAALKKQLNARRANARNGQIPVLEGEIEREEALLAELRSLQAEQSEAEDELTGLREREHLLRADLAAHDRADRQERYAAWEQAKRDAERAAGEARTVRQLLADSHAPAREVLEENRDRLRFVADLEQQRRDAEAKQADAERALNRFDAAPRPAYRWRAVIAWLILFAISLAIPAAARLVPFELPSAALCGCIAAAVLSAALLILEWRRGRLRLRAHAQERDALSAALREAEAVCAALQTQIDRRMALVYDDIPAGDAVSARYYVDTKLAQYGTLERMEADADNRRRYCESFPEPEAADAGGPAAVRPERSREALQYELDRTAERRTEAQRRADYAAGRLQAVGDAGELAAALAQKRERLSVLQDEYAAVALALEALERANTVLQNRFSPALGKRASVYFSALTGGRYDAMALDRSFHALISEAAGGAARDAALLSRGTIDQLYLAIRLAICDTVLPEEKHVPLVLDDALINFDDARCAAALELLVKAAETRQILLLTCQHREAAYLAGRENVTILTL